MRALSPSALAACAVIATVVAGQALAFDNTQFCQAATHLARVAAGDVGTWVDRTTRNDGVEIACDRKVVHFKRYFSAPATSLRDAWQERRAQQWEDAYCKRSIWREAVDNGWVVSATVTTVTGEQLWLACLPGGRGFHRSMPK
jgi:hypothetical protein